MQASSPVFLASVLETPPTLLLAQDQLHFHRLSLPLALQLQVLIVEQSPNLTRRAPCRLVRNASFALNPLRDILLFVEPIRYMT